MNAGVFDFALDPALGGPVASSSRGRPDIYASGYQEESEDEEEQGGEDDAGDDSERSEDETDAEDEYQAGVGQDVRGPVDGALKRKRTDKGKEREDDDEPDAASPGAQVDGLNENELEGIIDAIRAPRSEEDGRRAFERVYDRSIEEELDGIDEPFGGTVKRKGRRAVADLDPSPEVESILREASSLYGLGQHHEAIKLLTEVIRIDPSVRKAWVSLATNHDELGNYEKALKFKIVAAHLMSAKAAAIEWADLGKQSRDQGLLSQAIYCFTQAIKGDKTDVDSMWDRAVLLKMDGNPRQAIAAFTALLVVHPHDPGVLRELVPLLVESGNNAKARTLLQDAFEWTRDANRFPDSNPDIPQFGVNDLASLAALHTKEDNFAEAVTVIRTGARWLQGRINETSWDLLPDDREFDPTRKTRSDQLKEPRAQREAKVYDLDLVLRLYLGVARLRQGKKTEAKFHFAIILESDPMEIPELVGSIAEAYMVVGLWQDAVETFTPLTRCDTIAVVHVWSKMGECYKELREFKSALDCFKAVVADDPNNLDAKMQLARTYEAMGNGGKAWELINDVRMESQKLREQEAAEIASGRAPRKRADHGTRVHVSKEDRKKAEAARRILDQQTSAEYSIAFEQLEEEYDDAFHDRGDARAEWLAKATMVVDAFRETRVLFPSDKFKKYVGPLGRNWKRKGAANDLATDVDELTKRLERSQAKEPEDLQTDTYRGIAFERWVSLMCKYAIVLTLNDEDTAAQETLSHVSDAAPFVQSAAHSLTLRLARCSCYLYVKDFSSVVTIGRWIWLRYQYQTDPMRLLQAMLGGSANAINAWNNSALQKFAIRQVKDIEQIADGAETTVTNKGNLALVENLVGKSKKKASPKKKKKASRDEDDEEEEEDSDDDDGGAERDLLEHGLVKKFKPTTVNPIYLVAYGTILMTSMSYKSAIVYLLLAWDLVPDQPLLCLYLGIAYTYRAMQRQSDNRHHQMATGMGFFDRYRKLRGDSQEVEYVLGRAYHQLMLYSFAVKHYERVLEMAEAARPPVDPNAMDEDDDDEIELDENDFSRVAAYNLSQIYLIMENREEAIALSRKWLSV